MIFKKELVGGRTRVTTEEVRLLLLFRRMLHSFFKELWTDVGTRMLFHWVSFCISTDATANLLRQLYGLVTPCASCVIIV